MVIYSLFSLKVSSSMASSNGYTDEQLNYYRICFVTTDILVEGLREIFKQEWDKLYKSTLGEWKDQPRNGMDFYNKESLQNQERNAHLLATMKNGNSTEWDCTMLFYAILFSDCVGARLGAIIRKNVDDLRKFKNEEFTHIPVGTPINEKDFQNAISKVDVAFQALGLPTVKIQDLKYQITFPTKQQKSSKKLLMIGNRTFKQKSVSARSLKFGRRHLHSAFSFLNLHMSSAIEIVRKTKLSNN